MQFFVSIQFINQFYRVSTEVTISDIFVDNFTALMNGFYVYSVSSSLNEKLKGFVFYLWFGWWYSLWPECSHMHTHIQNKENLTNYYTSKAISCQWILFYRISIIASFIIIVVRARMAKMTNGLCMCWYIASIKTSTWDNHSPFPLRPF